MNLRAATPILFLGLALPACGLPQHPRGRPDPRRDPARVVAPVPTTPLIVPRPRSLKAGAGVFILRPKTPWTVAGGGDRARLARNLREAVHDQSGVLLRRPTLRAAKGLVSIRTGSADHRALSGGAREAWWTSREGYRLLVNSRGISLTARTGRGAFYGIQTLAQLLRHTPGGLECPAVTIEDWPALSFRGAHWFPSASGVAFDRKLIRRIMARYKLNAAVIQCEAAAWRSHPEIAAPNSVSLHDLRGLVSLCREQYVEPIPLINCLGHADWMFRNGRNLELAEDPRTHYACCVSNPAAARLVKGVLREALAVFHPAHLHLGHDEAGLRGPFPSPGCPRCAGKTTTELLVRSVNRYAAWLRARHVQPIVWGDMLLAPSETPSSGGAPDAGEASTRREGLPKGMLVADWHYSRGGDYPSLALFQQAGLKPIACTWYGAENIRSFAQAAVRTNARGLLQTTWAGYFPDERVLSGKEVRQFSAFILAAEYAWSGRDTPPEALGYEPLAVFRQGLRYAGLSDRLNRQRDERRAA